MVQTCKNCGNGFVITEEDLALLTKLAPSTGGRTYPFPPPTHCFSCRNQRRWARRNHRKLYRRICDATGEEILSLYSADKPFSVYKEDYWWSDAWDPLEFGRSFEVDRPFFDQFRELQLVVPRVSMHQDGSNENCEYITFGGNNKNCYLAFTCFYAEDVYYSSSVGMSKNCVDCYKCVSSELLYQCVECDKCYNCVHCQNSVNCQDSLFLDDCRDCHHCLFCKNLRHKSYCIRNVPVSKEKFEQEKQKLLDGRLEEGFRSFQEWKRKFPNPATRTTMCEGSTGDYLESAKNCTNCFEIARGAEDCRHCHYAGLKCKDMMDCSLAGMSSELLYELVGISNAQRSAIVSFCRASSYTYYSDCAINCEHCFGCVGLRQKRYCIFNKQYSKEEYEALVPKIIETMEKHGEWGEFFPLSLSPFSYNETIASELYPLSRGEVIERGSTWKEEEAQSGHTADALLCAECKRSYRIIPQESKFYNAQGIPIPLQCPECRHRQRFHCKNPPYLWERVCQKCRKEVYSSYSPDRPEIIYCEECYLAELHGVETPEPSALSAS